MITYHLPDGSKAEVSLAQVARIETIAASQGKTAEQYILSQMPHKPLNVIDNPLQALACMVACWAAIAVVIAIVWPGATVGSVGGAK